MTERPDGEQAPSGDDATLDMADKHARPAQPAPVDPLSVAPGGRYEVEREFARGGLGRILAAYDRRLGRRVAIKELIHPSPEHEARFRREVRVTARLQHPSIVPVYEAGRWPGGAPYYAMRMVSGVPLAAILGEARTLDERLVLLPNLIAVADAMAYAHSQKVIHRDLKPGNILVGSFGETVVIDWGLAKDLLGGAADDEAPAEGAPPASAGWGGAESSEAPGTVEGAVMGTPAYMPPEQAEGKAADERADVYALGAILYHLLTGSAPYTDAASIEELLDRVRRGKAPPILARVPDAPLELVAVVEQAMARDPKRRYSDAQGFAEDLHRFATGQLVGAHRYSRWARARRWLARHKGRAALYLGVATVVVLALVLGALELVTAREAAERARGRAEQAAATERDRRAEAEAATHELYLLQARAALDRDPTEAIAWLEKLPEKARGWGAARVLAGDARARGIADEVLPLLPHDVVWARFSRGATSIAYWTSSNHVGVLDLATRRDRRVPDGEALDWTDAAGTTWRWLPAARAFRPVVEPARPTPPDTMAPGGEVFATLERGELALVRTSDSAKRTLRGHAGPILDFAFSADGASLVSASTDGTIRRWPVAWDHRTFGTGRTQDLWFVRAGASLLAEEIDGAIRVIDLGGGEPRILVPAGTIPRSLSIVPGGAVLAVLPPESGEIALIDVTTGRTRRHRVRTGAGASLQSVSMLPWERFVAVGTTDGLYVLDTEGEQRRIDSAGPSRTMSADGRTIATWGGDSQIRLSHPFARDASPPRAIEHGAPPVDVTLAPDGSLLAATAGDLVRLYDLRAGTHRDLAGAPSDLVAVQFSPDGRRLAAGASDGSVHLWTLGGARRALGAHRTRVTRIRFAPDSGRLVTASTGEVRLWDTESGTSRTLLAKEGIDEVRFAPDGLSIAVLARGTIHTHADDLPTNPPALRAWIERATAATFSAEHRLGPPP